MVRRRKAVRASPVGGAEQPRGLLVKLRAPGNPDFQQYAAIAPPRNVPVVSVQEAVQVCMAYIAEFELGSGNWGHGAGEVLRSGRRYAWISWNGRVWRPDRTTPHPDYPPPAKGQAPGA